MASTIIPRLVLSLLPNLGLSPCFSTSSLQVNTPPQA
ncbi:unnamed protein product [Brassica rapa subsp. trilocularis]